MNMTAILASMLTLVSIGIACMAWVTLKEVHARYDENHQRALARSPVRGEQVRHRYQNWVATLRIMILICLVCAAISGFILVSRLA